MPVVAGVSELRLALGWGLSPKATLAVFLPLVAEVARWCRWPRPWRRVRERAWWRETLELVTGLAVLAALIPLPWHLFLRRT